MAICLIILSWLGYILRGGSFYPSILLRCGHRLPKSDSDGSLSLNFTTSREIKLCYQVSGMYNMLQKLC